MSLSKQQVRAAMATEELPEEIVQEIQLRLPVKSLMRFRCVSKKWYSAISDLQFTKSHFKFACQKQTTLNLKFLSSTKSQFQSASFGDESVVRELNFPIYQPLQRGCRFKLVGSCNGLVCVGVEVEVCVPVKNYTLYGLLREDVSITPFTRTLVDLYIWNPSTGFVQNLPCPPNPNERLIVRYCGFGYVSATDDYKVVLSSVYMVEKRHTYNVEIFSVRAKSWVKKEAPSFRYAVAEFLAGTLLNETLHWIGIDNPVNRPFLSIFDLINEEFSIVALPNGPNSSKTCYMGLGVVSAGCLGVTRIICREVVELWVMREYKVLESWTQLFKFYIGNVLGRDWICKPVFCYESHIIIPYENRNGGEICLLRFDHQEEKFVDMVKLFDKVTICSGRYFGDTCGVIQYDESLVRLDY